LENVMTQRLDNQTLAPDGMRALGSVYGYVAKCGLPKALVDLVYLRASQINGCAFCINMHSHDLMKAGVPAQKLMLLSAWHEARGLFTPTEQAALQWAEAVTLIAGPGVPDAVYQSAIAVFTEKELVDLTLAIGLINTYNRLSISFRRTPDGVPAD
jgi:AhpD family alkylhydroperoxidase